MIYAEFVAERRRLAEIDAAMMQPLDVAVLAVQTGPLTPRARMAELVIRSNYLHRGYEDERVALPILEPACLGHGS